jgi:hypothetical protein
MFDVIKHKFSSIIPLLDYFDKNGYTGNPDALKGEFPDFKMTTIEEHLKKPLAK